MMEPLRDRFGPFSGLGGGRGERRPVRSAWADHSDPLLERVYASAPPGARLLLVDFWSNPTHTQPVFAALMAGEWLMGRGEGDVYSEDEICHLLTVTGWTMIARRPLTGPASLVVAERDGHDGIAHDS
jgi:hypothetical protein